MLSPRAQSMLETLPAYYAGEPFLERVIQAQANEIDRIDALLDQLAIELQPGAATDAFGLLAIWERHFDIPTSATAGETQRQGKVRAALRSLDARSSADVLATLEAAAASPVTVLRNTPALLKDTLVVTFLPGSYQATQTERLARRMWPAHRGLFMRFADGFVLDLSRLDVDSF